MRRTVVATAIAGLVILVTLLAFVFPVVVSAPYRRTGLVTAPRARSGVLDARDFAFTGDALLPLKGEWLHVSGRVVPPGRFADEAATLPLPRELTDPADTAGTVRLQLLLPESDEARPRLLGLRLRYFASAYAVWINGEPLATAGRLSQQREGFVAQYLPAEVLFEPLPGANEILIQFANFHHRRIRLNRLYVGSAEHILSLTQRGLVHQAMILGVFFLAAVYFGTLFLIQRSEPANLYLALIALVSAGRLAIVSDRILIRLVPGFPPELMMKLGYAGAMLVVPLIVLYVSEGFRHSSLAPVARIAKHLLWIGGAILILTPVRFYDLVFSIGQIPLLLLGAYAVYQVVQHRVLASVPGGRLLIPAGFVLLATGLSDVFRELGFVATPELSSSGMAVFLAAQGIFLAGRFQRTFERVEALGEENRLIVREIQSLNSDLEARVAARTEELEHANRRLQELSRTDALTGMQNRRAFTERLELERSLAQREPRTLSVLMIDIDYFKPYNDSYGHPAGDEVLRRIAEAIASCCERGADLPARYGGEEFVVLLPQTGVEGAARVANRIQRNIQSLSIPHHYSKVADVLTVSIGCATAEVSGDSPTNLIERADRALYAAKSQGRNRVCADGRE